MKDFSIISTHMLKTTSLLNHWPATVRKPSFCNCRIFLSWSSEIIFYVRTIMEPYLWMDLHLMCYLLGQKIRNECYVYVSTAAWHCKPCFAIVEIFLSRSSEIIFYVRTIMEPYLWMDLHLMYMCYWLGQKIRNDVLCLCINC